MNQSTELEQLIRELNDPRNQSAPETIDAIQKQIQRLQRESRAWQWGIDLLSHNEAIMRFYGALTLTIKINADWDMDKVGEDRNLINHLLENLVSSYVRLASIPDVPFVLQKLCTTLVAVFQKPQTAWALPVRHLTACTVANRYIPQDAVPQLDISLGTKGTVSGAQLRSLLMFPITLAEQESAISGAVREQSIRVRITNNVNDILKLIHFAAASFENSDEIINTPTPYGLSVHYDDVQLLEAAKAMLQLVPLWTSDIKIRKARTNAPDADPKFGLFEATVRTFPRLFQHDVLAPVVLQTYTALEESSHKLLQTATPGYETDVVASRHATIWLEQLVAGDFDPDALTYVNFLEACMSQVDVTSPEYLATGSYIEILRQVRVLLTCDGAAGVEDPVCQIALEVLTSVTEGFSDWPDESQYDQSMRALIKDACSCALNKVRIPQQELSTLSQTWDPDDRAKFQDFRYDVQDYLQNAFSVLGEALIEEIAHLTIEPKTPSDWDLFEAGLFGFVAFSDTFSNEPDKFDKYLEALFGCRSWNMAIEAKADVPDRVRQMTIKVIGENTGFLQRYTQFLIPSLNFLYTSLHMASSATAASKAIYTLCDAQRAMLAEVLPQFMSSLNDTLSIEVDARNRIYAAVGALIQAMPTEESKVEPLNQILRQVMNQGVEGEIDSATDHEALVFRAVSILHTISALGRGLRAPADAPIDLEKSEEANAHFWVSGPGSVVQQQLLHVHNSLLQSANGQSSAPFIEASCGVLRAGFTEEHPSPFKLGNSMVLELLSVYMQPSCPSPDLVMATASSYLASVEPVQSDNEFSTLWIMSVRVVNDVFANRKGHSQTLDSDFYSAALDFCIRLLPKWAVVLFQLPQGQDTVSLIMEVALFLVEDADTLPRRTAAALFTAIFEASGQQALTSASAASVSMDTIIQRFTPRIIAAAIRLLGGVCARSDVEFLAETIKKAVQKQPLLVNRVLKEVLKDENEVLTPRALQATRPEQRARFASQIEMLRGSRKTNEVIREFWIACKGSQFEYVV